MEKQDIITFENYDFSNYALINRPSFEHRRSPIMVTLSDIEITPVDLQNMMEAGMNVARFKMSQSTKNEKIRLLGKIDKAAMLCCNKYGVVDWPIATCVELKTCIVTTGLLEEETEFMTLYEGSKVILTCNMSEYDKCNQNKIFVDNPYLTADVKVNMEISIALDEIILHSTEIVDHKSITCVVIKGGNLRNMCYVSVRGAKHTRPYITKKDLQIIKFALEYQVDMITINYVRHVDTIIKAKQYMGKKIKRPIILSGLCTEQGLDNIDDIIKESDGIILSREFLPYELEPSKRYRLPKIQKWVAAKCQKAGKPFYISGGVFPKCLLNGKICDNEISDVANAVLDGASGFILKDYNEVEYVLHAIELINDTCRTIEPYTYSKTNFWRVTNEVQIPVNAAEACMMSCVAVANQTNARAIILPTVTGRTAKALLSMQPSCIIITVSTSTRVTRLLHTYRCVVPLMYTGRAYKKWHQLIESRVQFAVEYAVRRGWLVYGNLYVTLQRGTEASSFCDMVKIWTVTISKKALVECSEGSDDE